MYRRTQPANDLGLRLAKSRNRARSVGELRRSMNSLASFLLGDDPGAANLMKVAANALTALTLQSVGEVLALLRSADQAIHNFFSRRIATSR
jgi:3-hydroxyisobutyrate dehydrogenase-like beta-hydroxyacid dehydrogenase